MRARAFRFRIWVKVRARVKCDNGQNVIKNVATIIFKMAAARFWPSLARVVAVPIHPRKSTVDQVSNVL